MARWSGARRDEIRRLAIDCLDTYPDGHPRLRIPVGKGYAERSIPLHPQAAVALQPLIERARQQRARRRFDLSAGREVQHIYLVRGKLLSKSLLFDMALAEACTAACLVDSGGRQTITAHRFRHTIGWDHEAERHRATQRRRQQLLSDLGETCGPPRHGSPASSCHPTS